MLFIAIFALSSSLVLFIAILTLHVPFPLKHLLLSRGAVTAPAVDRCCSLISCRTEQSMDGGGVGVAAATGSGAGGMVDVKHKMDFEAVVPGGLRRRRGPPGWIDDPEKW